MRNRLFMGALSVIGVAMSLTGCTNPSGLDSISISPSTQALAVGQSAQLGAIGTYGNGSHLSTQPVSSGVTWSSNATSVATVSATGAVTGVASGSATITATAQGFRGPVTATATVTVGATTGGGGSTGGAVVSVAVIPSAQSVATAGQTTQFIAIGTTSTGATAVSDQRRRLEFEHSRELPRSVPPRAWPHQSARERRRLRPFTRMRRQARLSPASPRSL